MMDWFYINDHSIKTVVKEIGEYEDNIPKAKKLLEEQTDADCIIFVNDRPVGARTSYMYYKDELS